MIGTTSQRSAPKSLAVSSQMYWCSTVWSIITDTASSAPHEEHERALITAMLGHQEEQDDGDRGVHGVEDRLGNEAVRTALVQLERVVGGQEVQERTEQREPPAPRRRQAGGKQRERARGSPHDDVQLTDDARVEGQRRACLLAQGAYVTRELSRRLVRNRTREQPRPSASQPHGQSPGSGVQAVSPQRQMPHRVHPDRARPSPSRSRARPRR